MLRHETMDTVRAPTDTRQMARQAAAKVAAAVSLIECPNRDMRPHRFARITYWANVSLQHGIRQPLSAIGNDTTRREQ